MNKMRKHKVKQEIGASSSNIKEEHDLAYYIHDRVELMHQVFSMIKPKELKAMAPSCVQHISIDNLQELCTEELLGISSKRLCAILDGAEPPTDTESSSSELLETISLDSISSDDDVLSEPTSKKKHKHRKKHRAKTKHKHKHSSESEANDNDKGAAKSRATRAGLTVLELLELQARARAIRAQLLKDNARVEDTEPDRNNSSDEVEIKEEPPEVLEISSDEEKPRIEVLEKIISADKPAKPTIQPSTSAENTERPQTVTKVVNDLVITIPSKPTKKIKLNRNISVRNSVTETKVSEVKDSDVKTTEQQDKKEAKDKAKKKRRKNKDGSDHDEITLQLSDTEKMDLLEDLDRKNFDNFTSSDDSITDDEGKSIAKHIESNSTEVKTQSNEIISVDNEKIVENVSANESNKDIVLTNKSDNIEVSDVIGNKNMSEENLAADNNDKTDKDEVLDNSNVTNDEQVEDGEITSNKDLSEGEISETEKDVVCISDDDVNTHKKKKKKDKSKKDKSDFPEGSDQNFKDKDKDDDIYEILESDSDYEIDLTVSKEPTAEEIKALSDKIDERTNEEINNISWRDRYLDSKKVKKVLTTANLLNALRKKNRELKNKLSKPEEEVNTTIEGTIEEFNTLQGSTKYVDPPKDVTKEMKKDAKQLLKMYKMLLKYNDINRKKDPNRKKKKKSKEKKSVEN